MKNYTYLCLFLLLCACKEISEKKNNAPSSTTSKQMVIPKQSEIQHDSTISIAFLTGKFDPATHPDFILVHPPYSDGNNRYLHRSTWAAFKKMYEAAKKDSISLQILSATRNFESQKRIWEAKWTGKRLVEKGENLAKSTPNPKERALKILKWSSMPGSSRHHWGTDIDINAFENSYFEKGKGLKEYNWLVTNGHRFGFCQPYTPKGIERPNGYNEEKWHWSYLPLAKQLSNQAKIRLKDNMIKGFKGAETASSIGIVAKYVLGINKDCL